MRLSSVCLVLCIFLTGCQSNPPMPPSAIYTPITPQTESCLKFGQNKCEMIRAMLPWMSKDLPWKIGENVSVVRIDTYRNELHHFAVMQYSSSNLNEQLAARGYESIDKAKRHMTDVVYTRVCGNYGNKNLTASGIDSIYHFTLLSGELFHQVVIRSC